MTANQLDKWPLWVHLVDDFAQLLDQSLRNKRIPSVCGNGFILYIPILEELPDKPAIGQTAFVDEAVVFNGEEWRSLL